MAGFSCRSNAVVFAAFCYLWGDTVNTASRMESHGVSDEIHVSSETYRHLREVYRFAERGRIHVKGKGEMETYLLVDRIPDGKD